MSEPATSPGYTHGSNGSASVVVEINALRNEALQLLASIRRPLSPLKELRIRHSAGWLIVLADRMERDRVKKAGAPSPTHVLDLIPLLAAARKNRAVSPGALPMKLTNIS